MRRCILLLAILGSLACNAARADEDFKLQLTVSAGDHDRVNTPVVVPLLLPKEHSKTELVSLTDSDGKHLRAQLTGRAVLARPLKSDAQQVSRELHFILPELDAGSTANYTLTIGVAYPGTEAFSWHDTPGEYTDLRFGQRPVLRYMYKAYDNSTKQSREETYKVFHHLFDPAGKLLVTKGAGGEYPHHRGLFYGFNNVAYEGVKRADLWHCQGNDYQDHAELLAQEAGPVLGRHRVKINWHGGEGKTFAEETRELTVYNVPGGQLVEFASRLETLVGPVKLDGDPQHAGFQFRAAQEVAAKTNKQTIYLRPDGQGQPGETRNWPGNKDQVNLPWKAMSFVLGEQRFTAAYLDKPSNPKEARYSERDYGRFGSYFVYELTPEKPLEVNYRVWLQEGEMTAHEVKRLSNDFVTPPEVKVK